MSFESRFSLLPASGVDQSYTQDLQFQSRTLLKSHKNVHFCKCIGTFGTKCRRSLTESLGKFFCVTCDNNLLFWPFIC